MYRLKFKGEIMFGLDGNRLEFSDYGSVSRYREMHSRVCKTDITDYEIFFYEGQNDG